MRKTRSCIFKYSCQDVRVGWAFQPDAETSYPRRAGKPNLRSFFSFASRWGAGRCSGRLGLQDHGCFSGNMPVLVRVQRRTATTAIADRFAGPERLPALVQRRGQERLRSRIEVQVAAEVYDQQAIVAVLR